jgi:hypothetical protein
MNIKDLDHCDPFQTTLIMVLDRIARALEKLVEAEDDRPS